jgi:hypothetical protein
MGSPANLTLGPQVSTVTSAIETTLNCAASSSAAATEAGHGVEEVQNLAVYLRQLQEERGKIEAFKRELPLCMQLLDAGMAYHIQNLAHFRRTSRKISCSSMFANWISRNSQGDT